MAYADQQMSTNKIVALVIVALIHVFVGYALVTGLAYKAAQQVIKKVTTVDIKEEKPKEEEPPPPPPEQPDTPPPPIVAPPPPINIAPAPPQVVTVQTPPPAPPPMIQTAPPIQAAPPPPPGPSKARGVRPKGQAGWAGRIQSNYPTRAAREEREGRVGVRVQIGADGRVSACSVSSSSGSPDLDEAACDGMTRYARFDPALDDGGNPISSNYTTAIVYKLN
ncbi:energy transducer TonB [Novosphingobium sp. P6W]|uniref:energy transducer TonB n=1 Tax=Novosphingobium sp. P6W TaxID=1609758 RepID=UPI0005C2BA58|nr:energy transducer TonB [Novosphingobium sp. P6W]AXB77846.1 TonB family protein [Novosphingobium sp. P6W]KIS31118.1 energy transducer TonB [Novosphingobium sp. P6W]